MKIAEKEVSGGDISERQRCQRAWRGRQGEQRLEAQPPALLRVYGSYGRVVGAVRTRGLSWS